MSAACASESIVAQMSTWALHADGNGSASDRDQTTEVITLAAHGDVRASAPSAHIDAAAAARRRDKRVRRVIRSTEVHCAQEDVCLGRVCWVGRLAAADLPGLTLRAVVLRARERVHGEGEEERGGGDAEHCE